MISCRCRHLQRGTLFSICQLQNCGTLPFIFLRYNTLSTIRELKTSTKLHLLINSWMQFGMTFLPLMVATSLLLPWIHLVRIILTQARVTATQKTISIIIINYYVISLTARRIRLTQARVTATGRRTASVTGATLHVSCLVTETWRSVISRQGGYFAVTRNWRLEQNIFTISSS